MKSKTLLFLLASLLATLVVPRLAFAGGDASFVGGVQVQSQKSFKHGRTTGPAAPVVGRPVTFRAVIVVGGQAVNNLLVVGGIDGQQKHAQTYPRLEAGSRTVISFTWTATAGSHGAYFHIDPSGTGTDSNAANNRVEHAFNVGDCSTDILWRGRILYEGERLDGNTITAKATLLSQGGRASNVRITGGVDQATKLNRTMQKIAAGAKQEVSFQYTASYAGGRAQRVWFKASTSGCDIDPRNNSLADRSRPSERFPDLVVGRIQVEQNQKMQTESKDDKERFSGQTVYIRVLVENRGNGDAPPFKARIGVGRQLAGVANGGSTKRAGSPGAKTGVGLNYTFKKTGETKVTVKLDPLNQIAESDETNNEASYDLRVLPKKPELTAFWTPSTIHTGTTKNGRKRTGVGKRTAIEGAVMNKGFRHSQPTTVSVKCDGKKKQTRAVPSLKPGEMKTWKFWFRWASPVSKWCELRVDDQKKNSEYGTETNSATLRVAVRIK